MPKNLRFWTNVALIAGAGVPLAFVREIAGYCNRDLSVGELLRGSVNP